MEIKSAFRLLCSSLQLLLVHVKCILGYLATFWRTVNNLFQLTH